MRSFPPIPGLSLAALVTLLPGCPRAERTPPAEVASAMPPTAAPSPPTAATSLAQGSPSIEQGLPPVHDPAEVAMRDAPLAPPASGPLSIAAASPCTPADWSARELPPLLRAVPMKTVAAAVTKAPDQVRVWERRLIDADGCDDSPSGRVARDLLERRGERAGVEARVVDRRDAGKSGRDWAGGQCSYGVRFAGGAGPLILLGPAEVPPYNELTAIERDGSAAFLAIQFNGYAREAREGSSRVVAVDLCEGKIKWTSKDLTANGPIFLFGDYLISTYGFTAEPDFVFVHGAHTGKLLQKLPLPTAAEKLTLVDDVLVVETYNGQVAFKVLERP